MQEQADRNNRMDYAAARDKSAYDAYDVNLRRRLALAELTKDTRTTNKTSGFNSQLQQGSGLLNSIIAGAAQVGSAALLS
jgi:hypothetical protein